MQITCANWHADSRPPLKPLSANSRRLPRLHAYNSNVRLRLPHKLHACSNSKPQIRLHS